MKAFEANFDGLVGPTHNYGGLSLGNLASSKNKALKSNPKKAALQGLAKMKQLSDLGLVQGVIPPQPRPDLKLLRSLGFSGDDASVINKVARQSPLLLASCSSASSMWTANAATVSASADTYDGKVHFTPANLSSKFHRAIEPTVTADILQAIFANPDYFTHHSPLPAGQHFSDEGAANHSRLCNGYEQPGVSLFACGRYGFDNIAKQPQHFPARQTFEASQAIARQHGLNKVIFAQQNPEVIDQGVFHNDVICVANKNTLFCHESAFVNQHKVIEQLDLYLDGQLQLHQITNDQISAENAVSSYLFNSQLVSLRDNQTALIMPGECQDNPQVTEYLQSKYANWIDQKIFLDLRQSMKNGGGPACLRLRVVLNQRELNAVNQNVLLDQQLYEQLVGWVEQHYRDCMTSDDLSDPQLHQENMQALDELSHILALGSIYSFQK